MPEAKVKEIKETKATKEAESFGLNPEEMMKAGLHFGHKTSKLHPQMKPYLYGTRNTVHILDLEKTLPKFKQALEFIQQLVSQNKTILIVNIQPQHKELTEEIAQALKLPYVSGKWLGGTLTNFPVIKKRVEYLKELEEKRASGEWDKYTKKEKIKMGRDFDNLAKKFNGLKNLNELPDALLVISAKHSGLALKEARMQEIPIVAIVDTNADPTLVDYPIPANDDASSAVKYILEKIKEVILESKSQNGQEGAN